MKKKYITPLVVIGLLPLLSSCASQQDVQTLNYHVRTINKKLEDMKVNTVDQMQQRQANSSGIIDELQKDILRLKSQLEENAHMNRMLQEQNKELQLAIENISSTQEELLNAKFSELNARIATQNESLQAIQKARVQEAKRRSQAATRAAEEAMRKAQAAKASQSASTDRQGILHIQPLAKKRMIHQEAKPVAHTALPEQKKVGTTPASVPTPVELDSYSVAQQKYRDGDFSGAYQLFAKNAENKSDKETAIRARYMMGESLYKQGQFDQAIIQYQKIITNYPGNPQAAKALLRQGDSFEQLSDKETAKIIYKKLTLAYPTSPEAETAKKKMAALQ